MDNGSSEKKPDLRQHVDGINRSTEPKPIEKITKYSLENKDQEVNMGGSGENLNLGGRVNKMNKLIESQPFESQLLKRLKPDNLGEKVKALGETPTTERTVKKIETPAMSDAEKRVEIARIVKRLNKKLVPSNGDAELIKGLEKEDQDEETLRWAVTPANSESTKEHEGLDEFLESKKLPVEKSSENVAEKNEEEAVPVTPPPPIDRPGKPLGNIISPKKIINSGKNMLEKNEDTGELIRKLQKKDIPVTEPPFVEDIKDSSATNSENWREQRKKEGEIGAAQIGLEQMRQGIPQKPVSPETTEIKNRLDSFRKIIKKAKDTGNL